LQRPGCCERKERYGCLTTPELTQGDVDYKTSEMKSTVIFLITLISLSVSAQEKNQTTDQFKVDGIVKQELVVSLSNLASYKSHSIDSVVITNHLMQRKYAMKNLKGVLLKDILDKAEIQSATPKELSEFYIVCIAADNYKVVFSWNEIFNNKLGENIFVLTEHDGKPGAQTDDRIALISVSDNATGRRFVKWVKEIKVERVQ
jgi:hypothetical protein